MSHKYTKYIDDYMKDELKSQLKAELIEHAKNCSECSKKLNIIDNFDELVTGSFDDLPYKSRKKEIILAAESVKGISAKRFLYNSRRYLYAAVLMAVILAGVMVYSAIQRFEKHYVVSPTPEQSNNTTIPANDSKIENLQNQVKNYEKEIKELQDKISSYEANINGLDEVRFELMKFIDSAVKYLDDDELTALAKNEWSYGISIDGKPIGSGTELNIDKSDFQITLSERTTFLSTVQSEIFDKGKISGNFYEHLKFIGKQPASTDETNGTVAAGMIYEFKNIQKGTVIKMQVSDELKARLGLQSNIINITVN